jgi:very-short-patch-repair endonuclease
MSGVKFRRQQPLGNYIVDFISFDKKLIIEIDGGQHNEDLIEEKDKQRTRWLESEGFLVMRFWNNDITRNPDGVFLKIKETLADLSPSP